MGNGSATYADFLWGVLSNPKAVSALTPSSANLARAIAKEVGTIRDGLIVELGPGTGPVTNALLALGIPFNQLLLIESEPLFVALLRRLHPLLDIRQGDALNLDRYLSSVTKVGAVVSGLPLLHFSCEARKTLILTSLDRQGASGLFVQLSYGWRPPVPPDPAFTITRTIVWSNFPPAHIWTYRKR